MDWSSIGQFISDVGIPGALAVLLVVILFYLIRSNARERERAAGLQDKLLEYMGNQDKQIGLMRETITKQDEQINLLKQTVETTSKAKELAIEANTQTTQANQEMVRQNTEALRQYLTTFNVEVGNMRNAGAQIVKDVNSHTSEAHRLMGEAIAAARTENNAQHTGQGVDFKQMVDENAKVINAHVDEAVEHNGDATRKLIIEQLKSINDRMDQLQLSIENRDIATAQTLHQLSTDLSKAVLLMTAPKVEPPTTLIADKPPSILPPVDPLANVAGKSEEVK